MSLQRVAETTAIAIWKVLAKILGRSLQLLEETYDGSDDEGTNYRQYSIKIPPPPSVLISCLINRTESFLKVMSNTRSCRRGWWSQSRLRW